MISRHEKDRVRDGESGMSTSQPWMQRQQRGGCAGGLGRDEAPRASTGAVDMDCGN